MNRVQAVAGFQEVFGASPSLVTRAPGRVNLIGEHTDYNDGWVMPAAIEFATWTAIGPRPDRLLRVHAGNRREFITLDLDHPGEPYQHHWSDYVRGIAVELERDGHRLAGADVWFAGDVPDGAGLSSSAALEMSVGLALLHNSRIAPDAARLALAGQRAEHHYAGTKCGIMDQFISAHARRGHALRLDCRSLEHHLVPLPPGVHLVICDTGVRHELAGGEYNQRRAQCEEGVELLRKALPKHVNLRALRDVSTAQFQAHADTLPELIRRRCHHVISENERVLEFARALDTGDLGALARLMSASHLSLRDDYAVSCPELDLMVKLGQTAPGCLGSRMTGGGFGGSTINLVERERVDDFRDHVASGYSMAAHREPRLFVSAAGEGAAVVPQA